jgi:hypothetical protein
MATFIWLLDKPTKPFRKIEYGNTTKVVCWYSATTTEWVEVMKVILLLASLLGVSSATLLIGKSATPREQRAEVAANNSN